MRSTKVMQGIKSRLLRVALSTRLAAPDYGHTCSIDPITASSFSFSRKSRSSYPYKLSKPVFGPRPDYNEMITKLESIRETEARCRHFRSCRNAGACLRATGQTAAEGTPSEDPLLLFSVLYGFWIANYIAFNGEVMRELAAQFLTLAKKQPATVPLMIGHRLMGVSLLCTGDMAQGRAHFDRAFALYDPAAHRSLATRFGQDAGVSILSYRGLALFLLGHPEAALVDAERALKGAREIGQAPTLMFALAHAWLVYLQCRKHAEATAQVDELAALADEKAALFWKAGAMMARGYAFALIGRASDAVQMLTSGITAWRSTGSTMWLPLRLSQLASAHADLGQFDDAWHCIGEAMTAVETTKETWFEAELHRVGGEIALMSPGSNTVRAERCFERALGIARQQQAKSYELRAAMSLARLWGDQGKVEQARELLAPVYGWFTEGFDTLDLKEAKALLEELKRIPIILKHSLHA
jgi:predicted ATPase